MLKKLPVFVQAVMMENILDEFETQQSEGEYPEIDGEMEWRMWCMLEDIPFLGFFHERYDTSSPFGEDMSDSLKPEPANRIVRGLCYMND